MGKGDRKKRRKKRPPVGRSSMRPQTEQRSSSTPTSASAEDHNATMAAARARAEEARAQRVQDAERRADTHDQAVQARRRTAQRRVAETQPAEPVIEVDTLPERFSDRLPAIRRRNREELYATQLDVTPTPFNELYMGRPNEDAALTIDGRFDDDEIARSYFRNVWERQIRMVSATSFLESSKETYDAQWMGREIIQNWIDHNQGDRGTLNGVGFSAEVLPDGVTRRYTIRGDWPFEDPSALYSLKSKKLGGQESAGGNGIGFKQLATRLMRDYDVARLEVQGEHWAVNFHIMKAADVNGRIREHLAQQGASPAAEIQSDWLIATKDETENSGYCAYVIETKDPELIKVFDSVQEIAVGNNNPFLERPQVSNQHGSIEFVPLVRGASVEKGASFPPSRLFLNGQVMQYEKKGSATDPDSYWHGPECVNVRLNNVQYKKSVDRPPLRAYETGQYMNRFIREMTNSDLWECIKKSAHLWSRSDLKVDGYHTAGYATILKKIVETLVQRGYAAADLQKVYRKSKFVYATAGLTAEQRTQLREKGYYICDPLMKEFGIPSADSMLSDAERERSAGVNTYEAKRRLEKLSQEIGVELSFEAYSDDIEVYGEAPRARELTRLFLEDAGRWIDSITEIAPGQFRIELGVEWPESSMNRSINRRRTDWQRSLHAVRGFIATGLELGVMQEKPAPATMQGELLNTYGYRHSYSEDQEPSLISKQSKHHDQSAGAAIEFATTSEAFAQALRGAMDQVRSGQFGEQVRPQAREIHDPTQERTATSGYSTQEGVHSIHGGEYAGNATQTNADTANGAGRSSNLAALEWMRRVGDSEADPSILESDAAARTAANQVAETAHELFYTGVQGGQQHESIRALERATAQMEQMHQTTEDFEIIDNPEQWEEERKSALRQFVEYALGARIPNILYIYTDSGSSEGLNNEKRAIGIKRGVMHGSFQYAVSILLHELGHNHPQAVGHDTAFQSYVRKMHTLVDKARSELINTLRAGEELSNEQEALLWAEELWEEHNQAAAEFKLRGTVAAAAK